MLFFFFFALFHHAQHPVFFLNTFCLFQCIDYITPSTASIFSLASSWRYFYSIWCRAWFLLCHRVKKCGLNKHNRIHDLKIYLRLNEGCIDNDAWIFTNMHPCKKKNDPITETYVCCNPNEQPAGNDETVLWMYFMINDHMAYPFSSN